MDWGQKGAATGRLLAPPTQIPKGGEAVDVTFARRGATVAVAQLGNRIAVVDPVHRKVLGDWKDSSAELSLGAALSPNGARVATTDFDGFLHVWDASTGRSVFPPIKTSEADADSVNWSPDGSRIVTANGDGTVRIYDAATGQQIGASLQPRTQGAASGSLNAPYETNLSQRVFTRRGMTSLRWVLQLSDIGLRSELSQLFE